MSFPQGISRLLMKFTIPLFLISAASVASSSSFQGATSKRLAASPSSVGFGNIQVGSSRTQHETLTNSGNSTVTISKAAITGAGFSLRGLGLPLSLHQGHSVTFSVLFTPRVGGSTSGRIAVVSNASNSVLNIALAGTGISAGRLTSSPTAFNFGSVTIRTGKTLTAMLTATGSSVKISSATSTSPEFSLGGLSFPTTIAPGQSASFTLTFTPAASGTASGSISLTSNATDTPMVETLTGSGTAIPSHSVSLSWSSSPSSVVGYNIYRSATPSGPYTKVNPTLEANLSYLDSAVQGGTTYYYVSTAVDGSGVESQYSQQLRAVIPSP
jgi:Abnormal spindle-like microcephaly-assoc'd, ASPM-SPD-2-Hydin